MEAGSRTPRSHDAPAGPSGSRTMRPATPFALCRVSIPRQQRGHRRRARRLQRTMLALCKRATTRACEDTALRELDRTKDGTAVALSFSTKGVERERAELLERR